MRNRFVGLIIGLALAPTIHLVACTWSVEPKSETPPAESIGADRLTDWISKDDPIAADTPLLEEAIESFRTIYAGRILEWDVRVATRPSFALHAAFFIGVVCPTSLILVGSILFLCGDRRAMMIQ